MHKTVPILAALSAVAACGGPAKEEATAPAATVRLAAVPGRPAAGYFTLRIEGDKGALVSVRSPQAGRIEMHETMQRGTMASMRPIARIPVRDGETLAFIPGGRHLMLYDLARTVEAGGGMSLIFTFERGAEQSLIAGIVPASGEVGH